MPKKKTEGTKKEEIPKTIDNIEEQKNPEAIKWGELDKYIKQPVWDSREKEWRVLEGYRRVGYSYSITFSDIADWVSYNDRNLYLEEIDKCPTTNK